MKGFKPAGCHSMCLTVLKKDTNLWVDSDFLSVNLLRNRKPVVFTVARVPEIWIVLGSEEHKSSSALVGLF